MRIPLFKKNLGGVAVLVFPFWSTARQSRQRGTLRGNSVMPENSDGSGGAFRQFARSRPGQARNSSCTMVGHGETQDGQLDQCIWPGYMTAREAWTSWSPWSVWRNKTSCAGNMPSGNMPGGLKPFMVFFWPLLIECPSL
jgi:hypothetical protein